MSARAACDGLVDASTFRQGMRRLAASVMLVTVQLDGGRRFGMTATAVCSVSADPPTLLCCVNRQNGSRAALLEADHFAVNVLAADEHELADRFARTMPPEERFAQGRWTTLESAAPVLETAVAAFDCRRSHQMDVGGHTVFFGQVRAVRLNGVSEPPLLYAHGGYGRFDQAPPPLSAAQAILARLSPL